jgi:hypothetical protein
MLRLSGGHQNSRRFPIVIPLPVEAGYRTARVLTSEAVETKVNVHIISARFASAPVPALLKRAV